MKFLGVGIGWGGGRRRVVMWPGPGSKKARAIPAQQSPARSGSRGGVGLVRHISVQMRTCFETSSKSCRALHTVRGMHNKWNVSTFGSEAFLGTSHILCVTNPPHNQIACKPDISSSLSYVHANEHPTLQQLQNATAERKPIMT